MLIFLIVTYFIEQLVVSLLVYLFFFVQVLFPQLLRIVVLNPGGPQTCYRKLLTHVESHASAVSLLESGE